MSRFVSILAGGSGTRLWPLSRSHRPKQLLSLLGDRSLLQATVDRVLPLVPAERILVVTEASHADQLRAQIPEIPPENVIVEPARRGTAGAVGLGAIHIAQRDPEATMASLHSDAAVLDAEEFRRALTAAFEVAESGDWLVTLGIQPSSPHTGMGYIQVGDEIGIYGGRRAHRAVRFVEKPDRATAERYVGEGYLWNPGMFIWRTAVILRQFAEHLPTISAGLDDIGAAIETARANDVLHTVYPGVPVETIDFGIMERARNIATIPADIGWSDVGSWSELQAIAPKDVGGNAILGNHLLLESQGNLVFGSDKPVFTFGIDDLVIVDLPDALLVCPRDRAEQLKTLVEEVQASGRYPELL
jgi:mannose-1-phosphate guanylyltransferase